MGISMRRAAAILSLSLLGLAGCQNFQGLTGYSPTVATMPGISTKPGEGNGASQVAEMPRIKNMHGTQSEKLEASLAAAKAMESSGKWSEAIMYYEQVRQLDPNRGLECSRHLAILYDRNNDFDKALDEYAVLLKANPKDATAYNDLGYGYYLRGKFEPAEKNLRKAVELDPRNKLAWSNLGLALAQLSRYDESLTAFEKVVNRPQAMCNIAFIQAAQGKWVEARDSYAMALKLEPGLQKARVALERMQEGTRANKDRDRVESRRRLEEMQRPPQVDPEIARNLPFGAPTGAVGAGTGMIYISSEDTPINLPLPGSYPPPAARTPAALPTMPQPPLALPAIPSQLEID